MRTEIVVRTDEVPEFRRIELARAAIALTKATFSTPGEEERYQEWLAHRQSLKRKGCTA